MIILLALLAYAAAAMLVAPQTLTRGTWRVHHPQTALALWLAAFLSGIAALSASMVTAIALTLALPHAAAGQGAGVDAIAITVIAWSALGVCGAMVALAVARSEPLTSEHHITRELLQLTTGACTYRIERYASIPVRFVRCATPIATSLRGDEPWIIISSCLDENLTRGELNAVIEHERTHLAQHHVAIAYLARLNRLCLPALFGAREFERATMLLIELIADDRAADAHGAAVLASALQKASELAPSPALTLRALRVSRVGGQARSARAGRAAGTGRVTQARCANQL